MTQKIIRNIPLNRVEGDLDIRVEVTDGVVTEAWSSGTMFRGIEKTMVGRGPLDGLVITPRVCGLCSICHLKAAAKALDMIARAQVPDDAIRLRNVAMTAEHIQSDMRHGFLMFATDFTNPAYGNHPLYDEAVRRYEAFKGSVVVETIRETKKLLEIIALIGGQWPHTSFMVPGGVASIPDAGDLLQCRQVLFRFRKWYEDRVLGCKLERWQEVRSSADLETWMEEADAHRNSELGFYIRFSQEAGLDRCGKGHGNFISYGSLDMPRQTEVASLGKGDVFIPSGFAAGTQLHSFDQKKVAEHVHYSWFEDYGGGKHPFEGETRPYASGEEGRKYSWAKAPRYDGEPAETGPLAEYIISKNPLFADLAGKKGPNVFVREMARLVRPTLVLPAMETWLREIDPSKTSYYTQTNVFEEGEGFGLTMAARGALGHWVRIKNRQIEHYQIITPTAWHASPRDSQGVRGPWEEALLGVEVKDLDNPVELGHVIRSYDSCMVCCVHALRRNGHHGKFLL
jgi:hydrogenase large subunit